MLNSDYGFEKDNIICVELNDELFPQCENFRHEISEIQTVQKTALGDRVFGSFDSHWGIALEHKGENKHVVFDMAYVDEHFFDLFNLKIKEGRGFDMNSNKTSQVIFNEELLTRFNVSDITGSRIKLGNNNGEVIGVVNNFNYSSLRHKINPVGFVCAKESCDKMFVKLTCHDIASTKKTLQQIEMIWEKYSPHFPINYKFIDEAMAEMYQSEIRFSKLIRIASILSLIIAGLGLIGITFKLIETRTKEIGIRKVNGAKLENVLYLLNADFMKWIVFSFLIAIPVAYTLMNQWLENFAYKTDISWWIFAVSGGIIIFIAAITISLQSRQAANRNPVEALRYE